MPITANSFSPFIPSEKTLKGSELPDKAVILVRESSKLAGHLPTETTATIRRHMQVINSYYSNLIEGNKTKPHEIRAAQKGDFSKDPVKRDLQLESIAHIEVQEWLEKENPSIDQLLTPEFIKSIHREFYERVPERLLDIRNDSGKVISTIIPGEFRTRSVDVGRHLAPAHEELDYLMGKFCETYHPKKYPGDKKTIAAMCAHHRLVWIHPFIDGNGRVARLFTDALLSRVGLDGYGVWCLSRGLARDSRSYKYHLDQADSNRQGDRDGRGQLSEKTLTDFCEFMLDTAIDQIAYMNKLLELSGIYKRIISYVDARNDLRVPQIDAKLNTKAALILYNAFTLGSLERSTAIALTGMADRTASRLLSQLRNEGLLTQTTSKSPLQWAIPEHAEPWYLPLLTPGI